MVTPKRPTSPAGLVGLLLGAALLLAPGAGSAQSMPSILELLPTEGRELGVGTPATGVLGAPSDYRLPDGQPLQGWEIRGEPGSWVWVDLVTDAFDAYLLVIDRERGELLFDDDSGGACHARIPVEFPPSGELLAVVTQTGVFVEGEYTLSASSEEPPVVEEICAYTSGLAQGAGEAFPEFTLPEAPRLMGEVAPDSGVDGTLPDGVEPLGPTAGTMESWTLELVEGQQVRVDLTSEAFDPMLLMTGPGIEGFLLDDDGGDGLNSRILFTVIMGGTYQLHVTGYGADSEGAYRLEVTETLPPPPPPPGGD